MPLCKMSFEREFVAQEIVIMQRSPNMSSWISRSDDIQQWKIVRVQSESRGS